MSALLRWFRPKGDPPRIGWPQQAVLVLLGVVTAIPARSPEVTEPDTSLERYDLHGNRLPRRKQRRRRQRR